MKINYGCGETKLEGFVNIDTNESSKPDLILDLTKVPFPYESESVERIHCIHNLEHIEQKYWPTVLGEFWRVLVPMGEIYLAYPEFEVCAKYFIENFKGMREFWKWTLYGRQLYPGDFHVVPMRTAEVIHYLENAGFTGVRFAPEFDQPQNTFVIAKKGPAILTKAQVLKQEIFNDV